MVPNKFYKFPRTHHLFSASGEVLRGDLVLSDADRDAFLSHDIVIEEKIDGANVGISITNEGVIQAQNRGAYIRQPSPAQFAPLWPWLAERTTELSRNLDVGLVIFGEWCFAVHSARYTRLPDWFLGFDVYDIQAERYWSSGRRNALLELLKIRAVPRIGSGRFGVGRLQGLLDTTTSAYGDGPVEGLYLRQESGGWLDRRAKVVSGSFIQAMDNHWSDRPLEKNRIVPQ